VRRRDAWTGNVGEAGDPATLRARSRVEVVGDGLVELEAWDGLGLGAIEGGRLIRSPVGRSLQAARERERGAGVFGKVEVDG
jgi:hypothetical protein